MGDEEKKILPVEFGPDGLPLPAGYLEVMECLREQVAMGVQPSWVGRRCEDLPASDPSTILQDLGEIDDIIAEGAD